MAIKLREGLISFNNEKLIQSILKANPSKLVRDTVVGDKVWCAMKTILTALLC